MYDHFLSKMWRNLDNTFYPPPLPLPIYPSLKLVKYKT